MRVSAGSGKEGAGKPASEAWSKRPGAARAAWQVGLDEGVVSFAFRIEASALGDGGRIKLGIVSRGADGKMDQVKHVRAASSWHL